MGLIQDRNMPSSSTFKLHLREPLVRVVTNILWRNLFIQAVYQVAVLLTLNFGGRNLLHLTPDTLEHSSKVKISFIFNTFVLCQVFNEFNSRKPEELNIFEGVSRNHLFLAVVSITVVLQVIIIEFLGKFTSAVRLSWELWLVFAGIASVRMGETIYSFGGNEVKKCHVQLQRSITDGIPWNSNGATLQVSSSKIWA